MNTRLCVAHAPSAVVLEPIRLVPDTNRRHLPRIALVLERPGDRDWRKGSASRVLLLRVLRMGDANGGFNADVFDCGKFVPIESTPCACDMKTKTLLATLKALAAGLGPRHRALDGFSCSVSATVPAIW